MCIMFLDQRHEKKVLPKSWLERCFVRHPHGVGLMYAEDGVLKTWRHLNDVDGLYQRYAEARAKGIDVAVHFRRGTIGGDNIFENVHPFEIFPGKLGLMHNGTIYNITEKMLKAAGDNVSDTRLLSSMLSKWPEDFLMHDFYQVMLDRFIGFDRLLFMDANGHSLIFNMTAITPGAYWTKEKHPETDKEYNAIWWSHDKDKRFIETGADVIVVNGNPKHDYNNHDVGLFDGVKARKKGQVVTYFEYGLFTKETLLALDGKQLHRAFVDYPLYSIPDGKGNVDPAVFWNNPFPKTTGSTEGMLWELPVDAIDDLNLSLSGNYFASQAVFRTLDGRVQPATHRATTFVRFGPKSAVHPFALDKVAHVPGGYWPTHVSNLNKAKSEIKAEVKESSMGMDPTASSSPQSGTGEAKPTGKAVVRTTPTKVKEAEAEKPKAFRPTTKARAKSDPIGATGGATALGVPATRCWSPEKYACPWCKSSDDTGMYITSKAGQGVTANTKYIWCNYCRWEFYPNDAFGVVLPGRDSDLPDPYGNHCPADMD